MEIDRLFKEIIDRIDRLELMTGTPRKPWPDMPKAQQPAAKKPGRPKKDAQPNED